MKTPEKVVRCPYGGCTWKAVGRTWADPDTADVYHHHFTGKHRRPLASTSWLIGGTPPDEPYPAGVEDASSWDNAWWVCAFSDGRACPLVGRHHGCRATIAVPREESE